MLYCQRKIKDIQHLHFIAGCYIEQSGTREFLVFNERSMTFYKVCICEATNQPKSQNFCELSLKRKTFCRITSEGAKQLYDRYKVLARNNFVWHDRYIFYKHNLREPIRSLFSWFDAPLSFAVWAALI